MGGPLLQLLGVARRKGRPWNSWAGCLFGVRDATLREDASRVRKGSAPEVLASLRDVVVMSLGRLNQPSNAAAIRRLMMSLDKAIELRSTPIQE